MNSKAKLEIQSIEKSSTEQIDLIKSQIIDLKNQKNNINSEIKNIGGKSVKLPEINQNEIKRIRNKYVIRLKV